MQSPYSRKKDGIFNVLLCLFLFYYSYRYIFQYNSSTTSWTYQDTPIAFKVVKYVLLVILIIILAIQTRGRIRFSTRKRDQYTLVAILFLIVQFLLLGVLTKNMDAIGIAVILIPAVFFLTNRKGININHVENVMILFWWFSFLYELVQLALYVKTGRLPALAEPNARFTDVRFGGAWDDPNGYALLMIFYVFYYLFKYQGIKQLAYVGATLLMLISTWSATGFIVFGATVLILLIIRLRDRKLIKKCLCYGLLATILVLAVFLMKREMIMDVLDHYLFKKDESVAAHMAGWNFSWLGLLTFLGIKPDYYITEVGFLRLISIGGIPALIAFCIISLNGCKLAIRCLAQSSKHKPILYGILAYIIGFILYNINLPPIINFSCFGVFVLFISLLPGINKSSETTPSNA